MRFCPRCQLKYQDEHARCFVDGTPLEPMRDARIGTLVGGRYLIEESIGEGGMARVYRARHTLVDRPVAIKIMDARFASDESLQERFRREAKNAASLAHPNIIEVHDYGKTDDGCAFMVMELLEGTSLKRLIDKGPMPAATVAAIGLQIARGMARAHDFSVLHRDLKPDNVFVTQTPDGKQRVKLLDFGIARSMHDSRLTATGEIFGTPAYMAPERVTSIDAGTATDLYALGVILFEMLIGRPPFQGHDVASVLVQHLSAAVPRPSQLVPNVPPRLDALVMRLLEKEPAQRPVDAHEVVKELQAVAPLGDDDSSIPVTTVARVQAPTLPPTTLERWGKRIVLFQRMLDVAYPSGAPDGQRATLDELRQVLDAMHALRSRGLAEQRKLDALEMSTREARERLGHAVQTLGADLSAARRAAREQRSGTTSETTRGEAERAYREAARRLAEQGGLSATLRSPSAELLREAERATEALGAWLREASAPGGRADPEEAVQDLEFQVEALRGQLEHVEAQFERERQASEAILREQGREVETREQLCLSLATRFCSPLRPRAELGPIFRELEAETRVT